jgi:hypothetical protein
MVQERLQPRYRAVQLTCRSGFSRDGSDKTTPVHRG